jgi:hypothetical protein
MTVVAPDLSPASLLARFRGNVVCSRPAFPDVLQLHVRDADGGLWRFLTFEADYLPTAPEEFLGKVVVLANIDAASGQVGIGFADGSLLTVVPFALKPDEVDANYESWQLFTPDGLVLNYGPGEHWVLKRASDPV